LNRFCVQAVAGIPLTVYGSGGQKRGFLNINDTLRCVELALLNTPGHGQYTVLNQFTEVFNIRHLAEAVKAQGRTLGLEVVIQSIENPRVENEEHYYKPANEKLLNLGLEPRQLSD